MMLQVEGDPSRPAEIEDRTWREPINARPEIPQLMQEAGDTSEPRTGFWHPLATPGRF
jgi:hypothetical protein